MPGMTPVENQLRWGFVQKVGLASAYPLSTQRCLRAFSLCCNKGLDCGKPLIVGSYSSSPCCITLAVRRMSMLSPPCLLAGTFIVTRPHRVKSCVEAC